MSHQLGEFDQVLSSKLILWVEQIEYAPLVVSLMPRHLITWYLLTVSNH